MYNVYKYNTSLYDEHGVLLSLSLTDTQGSLDILNINSVIKVLLDTLTESDYLQTFVSVDVFLYDDISVTQWLDVQELDSPFYEELAVESGASPTDVVLLNDWIQITIIDTPFYELDN